MSEIILAGTQIMTSREIAEMHGKSHKNVLAKIRGLESAYTQVFGDGLKFKPVEYMDSKGEMRPEIHLNKSQALFVASRFDAVLHARVQKRWEELEFASSKLLPDFSNPAVAARAWAEQYEKAQYAIATKAEIGSRREATSMNTASQATKKANKLEIELDRSKQYASIKRMSLIYHGLEFDWRELKAGCAEMGIKPIKVFDNNYGHVNAYHADVWRAVYAIEVE